MRSPFNFNHLECFFSLAKTLSFSKTSQELMIAQPAVSKQIKSLEEQFGVQLFLRTKQKVILSSAGKNLYDSAWPLYNATCLQIKRVTSAVDEIAGKIIFGCLIEIGEKFFIHALNIFKKKYPLIQFEVRFLKAVEIIEGVKNGTIDVGIVPDKIIQENIRIYDVFQEEIILVTSKKNAKNKIKQITQLPFVAFRDNDPLLNFYLRKAFPKLKLNKLNLDFIVNSHKAMIEVIKHNNHYGVLPALSIRNELEKKELINIGPINLKSRLYLIHLENEYIENKILLFRDYLRKYTKENS